MRLEHLVGQTPDFLELRELLGWQLLRLGKEDAAAPHFQDLAGRTTGGEIRSSALLGLAFLASRRIEKRQPGGWANSSSSKARERGSGRRFDNKCTNCCWAFTRPEPSKATIRRGLFTCAATAAR